MSAPRLGRRHFLAAAAAVVATTVFVRRGTPSTELPADARARVDAFLSDPEGAARLGRSLPATTFDRRAVDAIAPDDEDTDRWFATVDAAGFAAHVGARTSTDFTIGRVVVVDGWVLARTEAAVCAVAALAEGAAR